MTTTYNYTNDQKISKGLTDHPKNIGTQKIYLNVNLNRKSIQQ
jgi:hypothetical protein